MGYDHIVLVSIDTLRSDCLHSHPNPLWPAKYPNVAPPDTSVLDELAARGTYFANTISAAPYTSASHGTILSGRYPLHSGIYELYNGQLRDPTLFSHARRAGRRTVMKVDFPIILGADLGFTRDVDDYLVEEDDAFVDAVAGTESSVSLAHFGGVHVPYGFHSVRFGGDEYRAKLVEIEAEVPDDVPFPADQLVETYRDPEDADLLVRYKRVVQWLYAVGRYERLFELYLEGVEHFLTTRFRPWLERLCERLAGTRYLLVVFGDHGEEYDDGSCAHFNTLAEGVLRVPVILVGDDVTPQTVTTRVRTADILPTILDLDGLAPSPGPALDGESLADVVRGAPLTQPRPAIAQAYVPDTPEFVRHQRRQLAGEDCGPLRHVFFADAAYADDRRVVRTHHRFTDSFTRIVPVADSVVVERFDDAGAPHPDPAVPADDLLAALDRYNLSRQPAVPVDAPDDIRDSLRRMGYRL